MLMKMRSQMQRTNNQKGFTLVELMVVVVIIGILIAIAVPVYNNVTNNANKKAVEANLRTINGAIMSQQAATDAAAAPTKDLLVPTSGTGYLQSWPTGPTGVSSYGITSSAPYTATVTFSNANTYGVATGTNALTLPELLALSDW